MLVVWQLVAKAIVAITLFPYAQAQGLIPTANGIPAAPFPVAPSVAATPGAMFNLIDGSQGCIGLSDTSFSVVNTEPVTKCAKFSITPKFSLQVQSSSSKMIDVKMNADVMLIANSDPAVQNYAMFSVPMKANEPLMFKFSDLVTTVSQPPKESDQSMCLYSKLDPAGSVIIGITFCNKLDAKVQAEGVDDSCMFKAVPC